VRAVGGSDGQDSTTRPYDAAEYLQSPEDMAAYFDAALEDGDPALVVQALGTIARAHLVTKKATRQQGPFLPCHPHKGTKGTD
jgi:DNA-binding phage protein